MPFLRGQHLIGGIEQKQVSALIWEGLLVEVGCIKEEQRLRREGMGRTPRGHRLPAAGDAIMTEHP